MKHVILNSGGMDSALMMYYLRKTIGADQLLSVFVSVKQKYEKKESTSAANLASRMGIEHVKMQGGHIANFEHSSGIIPFRNAELILNAAQYGDDLYLGVLKDEVNSDKSEEFLSAMVQVLDISHTAQYWTKGRKFRIHTPLKQATKTEHLANVYANGSQKDWLAVLNTVSCYSDTKTHCGACPSCFKRWVALAIVTGKLQVEEYATSPWLYMTEEQVMSKTWSHDRKNEVLLALSLAKSKK